MDLLAGAAFAWCSVYVLLALYFAALAVARRTSDGADYAYFAAACVVIGGYALANGLQFHELDPQASARWGWISLFLAPVLPPLVLQVVLRFADVSDRARRWFVGGTSACAALCMIANATGGLREIGTMYSRTLHVGTLSYLNHAWQPRPGLLLFDVYVLASVSYILWTLVRAYLAGKREALLACIGGAVIAGCIVNDVLVMSDVTHMIFLSQYGFSAFAFGLSYTLLARHARVSEELTVKASELRRRSRAIRKSYEELRAAQQELVRREQLAVVGEIAAVVSHEVRNPLAIISNAVAGLRRAEVSADDRAMLLSILDEETDRLNRLVGDLLRYARPFTIERRTLDLDGLIDRALELARNAPTVKVERAAREAELPEVFGDPGLLRQVFDNLVQNACQAMAGGGTLSVRVVQCEEDGTEGVAIEIGDTGEGMDTQVRSRARTPFFTTRAGGTGLGLAICDRIVTVHGGVLSIKSRAGEGTIVSVFLPSGQMSEASVIKKPSSIPPPSGLAMMTPALGTAMPGSRRR